MSRVAPQLALLQAPSSCVVNTRCDTLPVVRVFPLFLFDGIVSVSASRASDASPVALSYSTTQPMSNGTVSFQDFTVFSSGNVFVVFFIDGCGSSCVLQSFCPCSVSVSLNILSGPPRASFVTARPAYLSQIAVGTSLLGPYSLSFLDALGNTVTPGVDTPYFPTDQSLLPSAYSSQSVLLVSGNSSATLQSSTTPVLSLNTAVNSAQLLASAIINGRAVQSLIQLSPVTHAPITRLLVTPCDTSATSSCLDLSWTLHPSGQPSKSFLVIIRSGFNNLNSQILYNITVQVPFLRVVVGDSSIVQMTASVCPAGSLLNATSCNGPETSAQVSLNSIILRAHIILISSSSAAITVAMSEKSGPRLPQFFSVSVTEVTGAAVISSFVHTHHVYT